MQLKHFQSDPDSRWWEGLVSRPVNDPRLMFHSFTTVRWTCTLLEHLSSSGSSHHCQPWLLFPPSPWLFSSPLLNLLFFWPPAAILPADFSSHLFQLLLLFLLSPPPFPGLLLVSVGMCRVHQSGAYLFICCLWFLLCFYRCSTHNLPCWHAVGGCLSHMLLMHLLFPIREESFHLEVRSENTHISHTQSFFKRWIRSTVMQLILQGKRWADMVTVSCHLPFGCVDDEQIIFQFSCCCSLV